MNLKEGQSLIAKNKCRMDFDNRPTLTIGKSYPIVRIENDDLFIVDDEGDNHSFSLSENEHSNIGWKKYFE